MSTDALDLAKAGGLAGAGQQAEPVGHARGAVGEEATGIVTLHRDPDDVRLLLSTATTGVLLTLLLLASLACNVWMYYRRPDRIVVERTADGDRVVMAGDSTVLGGVSVGPDRPGDGDKKTIANKWATARYGVDPLTRARDVERLFRMMEPRAAKALSDLMKRGGELERERAEGWQAVWRPQSVTVEADNPYKVSVIGTQEITRRTGGATERESRQLVFKLKLIADREQGRADRNQNTGFLVVDILDYRELAGGPPPSTSGLTTQPLP
jgi:hypothetical protein